MFALQELKTRFGGYKGACEFLLKQLEGMDEGIETEYLCEYCGEPIFQKGEEIYCKNKNCSEGRDIVLGEVFDFSEIDGILKKEE